MRGKDVPEVVDDDGTGVRVICGSFWGKTGPVDGIAANPRYLDVTLPAGLRKTLQILAFSLDHNTARALRTSLELPVQEPEPLAHPPPQTLALLAETA